MSKKNSLLLFATALFSIFACFQVQAQGIQDSADRTVQTQTDELPPLAPPIRHNPSADSTTGSIFAPNTVPSIGTPDNSQGNAGETPAPPGAIPGNVPENAGETPAPPEESQAPPVILPDRPPIPVPPNINLPQPLGSGVAKPPLAWRAKAYRMAVAQDKKPDINTNDFPPTAVPLATNGQSVERHLLPAGYQTAQNNSGFSSQPSLRPYLRPTDTTSNSTSEPIPNKKKHHNGSSSSSPQIDRIIAAGYDDTLLSIISSCPANGFKIESMNSSAGQIIARTQDDSDQPAHLIFAIQQDSPGYTRVSVSSSDPSVSSHLLNQVMNTLENTISRKGSL